MNLIDDLKALQFIATWLNYSTDDCAKLARVAVQFHAPHLVGVFSDSIAHNEVKSVRESHNLVYLVDKYDIHMNIFKFHDSLESAGIIEFKTNNEGFEYLSITPAGSGYGVNAIVPNALSHNIKEQPHWYDDTFLNLVALANNH